MLVAQALGKQPETSARNAAPDNRVWSLIGMMRPPEKIERVPCDGGDLSPNSLAFDLPTMIVRRSRLPGQFSEKCVPGHGGTFWKLLFPILRILIWTHFVRIIFFVWTKFPALS